MYAEVHNRLPKLKYFVKTYERPWYRLFRKTYRYTDVTDQIIEVDPGQSIIEGMQKLVRG